MVNFTKSQLWSSRSSTEPITKLTIESKNVSQMSSEESTNEVYGRSKKLPYREPTVLRSNIDIESSPMWNRLKSTVGSKAK